MENEINLTGIFSQGYGVIAKQPMRDKNLTNNAKAIYAYLCSFSGNGKSSFPSTKLMMDDLGFKDWRTFKRHIDLLIKYEYVSIEKTRDKGRFDNNRYTIITNKENDCPSCNYTSKEKYHTGKIPVRKNSSTNNNNLLNNNKILNNNSKKDIVDSKPESTETKNYSKEIDINFEKLWSLYPLKRGKGKVSKSTKKELYKIGFEKIKLCIERYIEDTKLRREDFEDLNYKNGSTFFYSGYQDYLGDEFELYKPNSEAKSRDKPVQSKNYEQREYDDDFFDSLYENTQYIK
jgi:hypothetical protein